MVPEISPISSAISHRNVRTRIKPENRRSLTNPTACPRPPQIFYPGRLPDLRWDDVQPHAFCIYPYIRAENMDIEVVQRLNHEIVGRWHKQSPFEAANVCSVLR